MKERTCLWCSKPITSPDARKAYCDTKCRHAAGNYMASRGKVVMPMLLAWRATRGRKGTAGASAYQEIQQFVDACCAELSAQGSPPAKFFATTPDPWMDRQRKRPSRVDEKPAEA